MRPPRRRVGDHSRGRLLPAVVVWVVAATAAIYCGRSLDVLRDKNEEVVREVDNHDDHVRVRALGGFAACGDRAD